MEFFLDFSLCKAIEGKDQDGNYLFQVEASNENVDFQDQIVLQSALMGSKDNFLKNGVISYDHLHRRKNDDGVVISDPAMIIGEPVDVWTEGDKTFVKGILYKTNEMAQEIIKLLKAGSTRIRASVGGLFPQVRKGVDGVERVESVLWNDLALTPCPVNNTVSAASFAKSFTATDFAKALTAGSGTDSSSFTGGRTLVDEDMEKKQDEDEDYNEKIAKSLFEKIANKDFATTDEILSFLEDKGINREEVTKSLLIINSGGINMVKRKPFSEVVDEMLKSLQKDKSKEQEEDNELEFKLDDEGDEDDDEDKVMKKSKPCKKSKAENDDEYENDEYIEADDMIKSLQFELETTKETTQDLKKSIDDIGDAIITLARMVAQNIEMTKSYGGESLGFKSVTQTPKTAESGPKGVLSVEEFKKAQEILCKSVNAGEIDAVRSSMIERDMQLAMNGKPMEKEYWDFISKRMGGN